MAITWLRDRNLLTLESKRDALARLDLTDARKRPAQTLGRREGDLIVVAGGGSAQDCVRPVTPECTQGVGARDCFDVQFYFDFRNARQMSQIGNQPVGDIDGCAGEIAFLRSRCDEV